MANIFIDVEKGIEIGAQDILHFLAKGQSDLKLAPAAIAGLATILGAVSTAVSASATAAQASGVNIELDESAWSDIKLVWPSIVAEAKSLGIKL